MLLTGKPPFEAESGGQLVAKILEAKPVPFEERGVRVPRKLKAVVLRLLAKKPESRHDSYQALRRDLIPLSSSGTILPALTARYGAFLIDQLVWMILEAGFLAAGGVSLMDLFSPQAGPSPVFKPPLGLEILTSIAMLTYFASLEFFWQKTPGKALFRLSLIGSDGSRVTLQRAVRRNLIFWFPFLLLEYAAKPLAGYETSNLLPVLGPLVNLITMRRSNGFACLHELLSGTCVTAANRGGGAYLRASGTTVSGAGEAPVGAGLGSRGPYRVLATLWEKDGECLLLARDDALGRNVWIHEKGDGAGNRRKSEAGPSRANRLRWLQGGVRPGACWEAYEAPFGTGFKTWLGGSKRVGWSDTRELLLQLMIEIRDGLKCGDLPASLSLRNLWIDEFGRLRLLEFGSPDSAETSEALGAAPMSWPAHLQEFVATALAPDRSSDRPAARASARIPIPAYATAFVEKLNRAGTLSDLEVLTAELRDLNSKPASVSPAHRLGHLATCWLWFPVLNGLTILVSTMMPDTYRLDLAREPYRLSGFLGFLIIPALLLAFAFRGGPILRLFGMEPISNSGRPAGRLRCLFRAAVAHAPLVLTAGPYSIARIARELRGSVPHQSTPTSSVEAFGLWLYPDLGHAFPGITTGMWNLTGLLVQVMILAGLVVAVLRPERSLHDRIAGTRLMPR